MSVVEVDPVLALDAAVMAAVANGHKRLGSVFQEVETRLPIEKREVKASLQRLRKAGRVKCNCETGCWSVLEPAITAVKLDPLITDNMLLEAAEFANIVAQFNSWPNDVELARDVMRGPPHSGRSTWHICVLGYVTMRLRGVI